MNPKKVVHGVNVFLGEVHVELKKSVWPTRPELLQSTIVVIISCIALSLYIGLCDQVLIQIFSWILARG